MTELGLRNEQLRILRFWWMSELFSPQPLPKLEHSRSARAETTVIDWLAGDPLPWDQLPVPKPVRGRELEWSHTAYLGVYALDSTFETLRQVFSNDETSYQDPPGRLSACAVVSLDANGRILNDGGTLSSALWAVGRIHSLGPKHPTWMEGFAEASQNFAELNSEYGYDPGADEATVTVTPCTEGTLLGLLSDAQLAAGINHIDSLATLRIRIQSTLIGKDRAGTQGTTDFLNSFYLDELHDVRRHVAAGKVGIALNQYLTGDTALNTRKRIDVIKHPEAIDKRTRLEDLPLGRWPSNPEHALALSQQFAVNQSLNVLGKGAGISGVNGPPGTGKTTMLRDILAGNVVKRAQLLAGLENPADAFTSTTHSWKSDGFNRTVHQLREDLTGFEMVVAAANNAAVENITHDIPVDSALDERWRGNADYHRDIATAVLTETTKTQVSSWGLVAARLGQKKNREAFRSAFWFDNEQSAHAPERMQTLLKQWSTGVKPFKPWEQARKEFGKAQELVDGLLKERVQARRRLAEMPVLVEREESESHNSRELSAMVKQRAEELQEIETLMASAELERLKADELLETLRQGKPDVLERIKTHGSNQKEWATEFKASRKAAAAANARAHEYSLQCDQAALALNAAIAELNLANQAHAKTRMALGDLKRLLATDSERFGAGYPGDRWNAEARELHAPWLDAKLDAARSELFLAALELHKDFLASNAARMKSGLHAAIDVVAGKYPRDLETEKIRAAWQLFFMVVPMVSTTFASANRLFGNIGREAIGWLLIDESGQASPQYAAGSIWRAKRVLAVGDPMQLEPVVTIPEKAQFDIAHTYGVSETWIPPKASVQTLADRVSPFGTYLPMGDEEVWIGAPLRVHRRCDEPMFSLCNEIAYNGIMINGVDRQLGTPEKPDPFDGPHPDDESRPRTASSFWADEEPSTPGSHLQAGEMTRVRGALGYLRSTGIAYEDIIAISPFRKVADALRKLTADYPGLRAGTIHTAQGREAQVVLLVLGGDPSKPGAKAWTARTPNLVNVAASRAQRRLYVIGDREAWIEHNYFRQLSEYLDPDKHAG